MRKPEKPAKGLILQIQERLRGHWRKLGYYFSAGHNQTICAGRKGTVLIIKQHKADRDPGCDHGFLAGF
jgi:hypothetical protein